MNNDVISAKILGLVSSPERRKEASSHLETYLSHFPKEERVLACRHLYRLAHEGLIHYWEDCGEPYFCSVN